MRFATPKASSANRNYSFVSQRCSSRWLMSIDILDIEYRLPIRSIKWPSRDSSLWKRAMTVDVAALAAAHVRARTRAPVLYYRYNFRCPATFPPAISVPRQPAGAARRRSTRSHRQGERRGIQHPVTPRDTHFYGSFATRLLRVNRSLVRKNDISLVSARCSASSPLPSSCRPRIPRWIKEEKRRRWH